jgi:HK97 family phage major capsid protein
MDRYSFEDKLDALTTSLGTRLGAIDRQVAEIRQRGISNNREIHRRKPPQPELSGAQKVAKHAVLRFLNYESVEDGYRERYAKSAVAAGSVSVPSWAGVLSSADTANFLLEGAAPSLLARLLSIGLDTGSGWPLKIGYRSDHTPMGNWTIEADPAPVGALSLATFTPISRKVAGIAIISRELRKHSNPQIEAIISTFLRRDLNSVIDGTLLDDKPADAARPAGLLFGVTATPPAGSLIEDLKLLAAAILDAGGTAPVFIVNPLTAIDLGFQTGTFAYPVFDSPYCPAGRIVAIDSLSFAGSLGALEITSSEEATVHLAAPAAPVVDGSGVVATELTSLWQTGRVGLSGLVDAAWGIPVTHVAYTDQVAAP